MNIPIKVLDFIEHMTGYNHESINDLWLKWSGQFRTLSQNNALHLYFDIISEKLNELGWTFVEISFFTGKTIEYIWTPELVKEKIWKKIQIDLFAIKSTTKLTTQMINTIIEILNKHFAENRIDIEFPNWQSFLNKIDKQNYKS